MCQQQKNSCRCYFRRRARFQECINCLSHSIVMGPGLHSRAHSFKTLSSLDTSLHIVITLILLPQYAAIASAKKTALNHFLKTAKLCHTMKHTRCCYSTQKTLHACICRQSIFNVPTIGYRPTETRQEYCVTRGCAPSRSWLPVSGPAPLESGVGPAG